MAGTRISFKIGYTEPGRHLDVEHHDAGQIIVFNADYVGGQGVDGGWILHYAVMEPIEDDPQQAEPEPKSSPRKRAR